MGWTIGMPSLKLNNVGTKSKSCGGFAEVAAEGLEEREGHDKDIDKSKSHLNVFKGYKTAAALQEYSRKHIEELSAEQRAAGKRGVRADAVVMCATIIKPPAAFMNSLSLEDQNRFLDDAREKLIEIVGAENVKSEARHFDELGAHEHFFWEPMTADGRLCAKEMHNLQFFSRLNREMPEHLRSKGWDIDDCHAYDQAAEKLQTEQEKHEKRRKRGRNSAVYKLDAEKSLNRAEERLEVVEQALAAVEPSVALIETLEANKPKKGLLGSYSLSEAQMTAIDGVVYGGAAALRELAAAWEEAEYQAKFADEADVVLKENSAALKEAAAEIDRLNEIINSRPDLRQSIKLAEVEKELEQRRKFMKKQQMEEAYKRWDNQQNKEQWH